MASSALDTTGSANPAPARLHRGQRGSALSRDIMLQWGASIQLAMGEDRMRFERDKGNRAGPQRIEAP